MQLAKETKLKIIRDAGISLFIYALPIFLMFLSFKISGKKPWLDKKLNNTSSVIHR